MPHRYMNMQDVAALLGMDQRRVERMAQRGQIPCQKVGGRYRFNRAEITEWLQQHLPSLDSVNLADMDAGITAQRQVSPDAALVSSMVRTEAISCHLPARTKNSVLKELVELVQKTGLLYDGPALLEALCQREELCSTALEGGIAIPHPRRPLPYAVAEPLLAFARTSKGIGFGAPDGRLTDLFFMICCPDDRHHLHVLARLCRLLHDDGFCSALRHVDEPPEVIRLIRDREIQVLAEAI